MRASACDSISRTIREPLAKGKIKSKTIPTACRKCYATSRRRRCRVGDVGSASVQSQGNVFPKMGNSLHPRRRAPAIWRMGICVASVHPTHAFVSIRNGSAQAVSAAVTNGLLPTRAVGLSAQKAGHFGVRFLPPFVPLFVPLFPLKMPLVARCGTNGTSCGLSSFRAWTPWFSYGCFERDMRKLAFVPLFVPLAHKRTTKQAGQAGQGVYNPVPLVPLVPPYRWGEFSPKESESGIG